MKVKRKILRRDLIKLYDCLFKAFGPQHWWPAESPCEVAVGAILTQNTNWANVEKAISRLKKGNCLAAEKILNCNDEKLQEMIRPAGYFRVKAQRLKNLCEWWIKNVRGDLPVDIDKGVEFLRNSLLNIKGVGRETADSILLYCFNIPVFVVDAYTRRIMSRHFGLKEDIFYDDLQRIFTENLPFDRMLYNEFHALIVRVGKEFCKKNSCREDCPLISHKMKLY